MSKRIEQASKAQQADRADKPKPGDAALTAEQLAAVSGGDSVSGNATGRRAYKAVG